ncbi:MAG: succinylglutamate desuccinylase/aspartoacylase family protein [Woeseia sp.]|nr:succinylglutamate desuccinylase/aspartoacylase family protein [Woeseia sp.]MBT8096687.1 succinylglutamate desuccinylase/aspartoacylase family protein [Woeseia sp.]NNE60924.1 succinylglutamate desuccinylase/aspartoacylase family protein [Woeseia sp.]NNL54088.1 succinylglutamate desuccinylase/aspartoacylase family protein [Woeseia sp.]
MAKKSDFKIFDTVVAAGSRGNVNIPVADLYTSTSLHMPVQVINGKRSGPVLFVSAAVHGDELNGVEIVRRLLRLKTISSMRGTLIAVPIVNVHGFLDQSRYLPDRRDLNRSFPGSAKGSIAARLANIFLKEVVKRSDYGIDLHTGAIDRSNLPQIRANLDDKTTMELAKVFGVPVIINASVRDGSLRGCAADMGKPVLTYEAGEALRFEEVSIRAGLKGILNVMRNIGMLQTKSSKSPRPPVVARSTTWIRSPSSGIVSGKVKLGASIREGQRLAVVSDPLGTNQEEVLARFDGIVIGRSNLPLAHEGDALFNIAAFRSVEHAEGLVEQFASRHERNPDSFED